MALREVYLFDPDQGQIDLSSATATNPGGSNWFGEHPPSLAIDDAFSKWYDSNRQDLIISLAAPTAIAYCGLQLAEDWPSRDPVLWEFLLSQDGQTWLLVYENTDAADVPDVRSHKLLHLPLAALWRDFLFEATAVRSLTDGSYQVQVGELQFWDGASPPAQIDFSASGATATSWENAGTSPVGGEPGKAIDGDLTTSWVESEESAGQQLILGRPVGYFPCSLIGLKTIIFRNTLSAKP